jgi:hypothetical protein
MLTQISMKLRFPNPDSRALSKPQSNLETIPLFIISMVLIMLLGAIARSYIDDFIADKIADKQYAQK